MNNLPPVEENLVKGFTERVLTNELINQTRTNYETLFNTIDDFLFVLDEQGNILHTNSTVVNRLGYSPEELYGMSVLMMHPAERREEAGRIVVEMLNGIAKVCPVPIVTKSGVQISVETRVTQGTWDGKPALFGVTKDISALKLSEEKFSKVFFLNPSACGISGLEDHKYYEVNQAFYNLFGFKKDEVIGKTASELEILNNETMESVMSSADETGNVTNAVTKLKTKNGDFKHVLLSSENIYVQDKKFRFTVVNDITERKKFEMEMIRKNEALALANLEKDRFFSIIAHDLRSPLSGFLGLTEIMVKDLPNFTPDEVQNFALTLRNSATDLNQLIENLLKWSLMEQGLIHFNPMMIPLRPIGNQVQSMVKGQAQHKNIELTCDIPEDLSVFADSNMLQTILRNMVSNAIKFTPMDGKVRFSASKNAENGVDFTVTDTGVGMAVSLVRDLFKLDIQTRRLGTNGEKSTGLGLIICKEFIEKHHGRIWVKSEVGEGTTFYFTIPSSLQTVKN